MQATVGKGIWDKPIGCICLRAACISRNSLGLKPLEISFLIDKKLSLAGL